MNYVKQTCRKAAINLLKETNTKVIQDKLNKFEWISFDLFDTLIIRDVNASKYIFDVISVQASKITGMNPGEFVSARCEAERNAYKLSNKEEITLKDIYRQFGEMDDAQVQALCEIESRAEVALSEPNRLLIPIFKSISAKHNVLIISDTYLDRTTINQILNKIGININHNNLFISSEEGVKKYSGNLYKCVFKRKKINPSEIIHIGNSLVSDFLQPRMNGMHSILYQFDIKKADTTYLKLSNAMIGDTLQNSFIVNHEALHHYNDIDKIGYEVLGPLLYSFCSWLKNTVPEQSALVFLAREGRIIKTAYETMYPMDKSRCKLIRVSRRSLIACLLDTCDSTHKLKDAFVTFSKQSVSMDELVNLGYLQSDEANKFCNEVKIDIKTNIAALDENSNAAMRFDAEIIPRLAVYAEKQKALFMRYVGNELMNWPMLSIIDVGWRGSMQDALSSMLDIKKCLGLYYGIKLDNQGQNAEDKLGFIFSDDGSGCRESNLIDFTGQVFELLFMDPTVGTTLRYFEDESGKASPQTDVSEYSSVIGGQIASIQKAALDYITDLMNSELDESDFLPVDGSVAFHNYSRLCTNPSRKTMDLLRPIKTKDVDTTHLLSTQGVGYWIIHPKEFRQEFTANHCKALFLKSVFRLPIPYVSILAFFKHKLS